MQCNVRIFLTELRGNPNKRNGHEETCLHVVCSLSSVSASVDNEALTLTCVNLLLDWTGVTTAVDETPGEQVPEKLNIAAVDEVSYSANLCKKTVQFIYSVRVTSWL